MSGTAGETTWHQLYDLAGRPLAAVDDQGHWLRSAVWANGQLLATLTPDGVSYAHLDGQGSLRARSRADGSLAETCTALPFGDNLLCSGSDPSPLHFTGKPRDAETGLDFFGARYYASSLGRFLTPDWSAQAEPVPYAKLDNPQSLNLYTYVLNNPVTLTDADGHTCKDPKKGCTITVQFRAFIPQKQIDGFKGDGRSFTSDPNASSRVSTTMTINTNQTTNSGNPLVSSSTTVGSTTLLPSVHGGATKTASGPQMPAVTAGQGKDGTTVIHIAENVRNPFQPAGNGIEANVYIFIPKSGASASVAGSLSGSPSFELNVSSQTGPTANIPIGRSSSNPLGFLINLESQRQVDIAGQVP